MLCEMTYVSEFAIHLNLEFREQFVPHPCGLQDGNNENTMVCEYGELAGDYCSDPHHRGPALGVHVMNQMF